MSGLNSVSGNAFSIASIAHQGLDNIRRMIDQGKTKQAEEILEILRQALRQPFSADPSAIADPQPFTAPVGQFSGIPKLALQSPLTAAQGSRIEGPPEFLATALQPGTREYDTVMGAIQQHEKLHFDAVSQRFFTRLSDGSKVDLCSVYDVQEIIEQNNGFVGNETEALGVVGEFFKEAIDEASKRPFAATNTLAILAGNPPPKPEGSNLQNYRAQVDTLKRKLSDIEAALELLRASARTPKMELR